MINEFKRVIIIGIIIIAGIIFAILVSFRIHNYNEDNIKSISISEKNWINEHYDYYKQYLIINDNGDNILTVIDFNRSINKNYYASWHVNDDFDLCLGYYIIKEENDTLIIDDSHVCD